MKPNGNQTEIDIAGSVDHNHFYERTEFMRNSLITLVCTIAFVTAFQSPCVNAESDEKDPPDQKSAAEIEKLVQQLGSSNGKSRELATKELLKVGEPALPFLLKATKSADPDVRRRSELLHEAITEEVRFAKAKSLGIDTLAERLVRNRKKLTKDDWSLLMRLLDTIRADGIARGSKIKRNSLPYLDNDVVVANNMNLGDGDFLLRKRIVCESLKAAHSIVGSLVLSSGNVQAPGCNNSIIIANGDVNLQTITVNNSIIVCDSSIRVDGATNSILMTRGSLILAWPRAFDHCLIVENENAYSSHRYFFSPLSIHINPEYADGRVRLINAGSRFKEAGINARDTITAIDGAKFESESGFRKLLRRAVAENGGVFDISPDGAKETVRKRVTFSP